MKIAGAALGAALVAGACGRSPLSEWTGAGGAGGAGSEGSATTTSTGSGGTTGPAASSGTGAGGALEPCDGLQMTGEPISIAASGSQTEPAMSVAPNGDVVLLHLRDSKPLLVFARFDAWGAAWPADLEHEGFPVFNFAVDFIAGPGPKGPSLLVKQSDLPGSIFFANSMLKGLDGTSLGGGPLRLLFITRFDDRFLAALSDDTDDSRMSLHDVTAGWNDSWKESAAWGCGAKPFLNATPVVAATSPAAGHQLVAVSSGAPFGECDSAPSFGPPTRLQIGRFKLGLSATLGAELELSEPVAHVALAPRVLTAEGPDGAWLVYQSDGSTSLLPPPIMAARLDATGALIGEPFPVTSSGATQGPIAAAALGERLIVVWYSAITDGPPSLVAQLIEPDGTPGASAWLTSEPWIEPSRLALLGSPDGTQFVVAWESTPSGPLKDHRVRIARFGCTVSP